MSSQYPELEYHGFDISPELIKLAKLRLKKHDVRLTVNDAIYFKDFKSIFYDCKTIKLYYQLVLSR